MGLYVIVLVNKACVFLYNRTHMENLIWAAMIV